VSTAQKALVAVAVVFAVLFVFSISQTQSCEEKAKDEYYDLKRAEIEGGGEAGGFMDNIDAAHNYAVGECS